MTAAQHLASRRDAGSFRDPSAYVFRRDGRVFRAVAPGAAGTLREFLASDVARQLVGEGRLASTRPVAERLAATLADEHPGGELFLEHVPLPLITYPYEWSVSALAVAGVLTLELQQRLLEAGYSLKDASAYNVQFIDGRAVFIDIGSIERPLRRDVWPALGQFQQMFLFPLLLARYHGWDLRSCFLARLGGPTVEEAAACLGWLQRWRPRYLLDVTLPALLQRRFARQAGRDGQAGQPARRELPPNPQASAWPQLANLRRLRRKIERLAAGYRPRGAWTEYRQAGSYSDEARESKRSLVRRHLEALRPVTVLDAGCNTGEYSELAAACGARVVALDADHDAVELLFRRLHTRPAAITPLVVDLCAPSPAIGFLNRERASFLDRVRAECVLALALIHHLHVAGNLPLAAVAELLARLTQRHVLLEFVPPSDPAFERLTSFRRETWPGYTLEACREALRAHFEIVAEDHIAGSQRTLLVLRRRSEW